MQQRKMVTTERTSFKIFLEDFYQEKLRLEPINATYSGENRYNHLFPNTISEAFIAIQRSFYVRTKKVLEVYSRDVLEYNDQISYDILLWECDMQLDGLQFPFELTPIDQMWTVNLVIGQLASGASAQPFETTEHYDQWLNRVDEYLIWCDTAIINMKRGIKKGVVLPTALIKKVIPQFATLAEGNFNDHLFYTPATKIPSEISEIERKRIKENFKKMVNDKVKPSYAKMTDFLANEYLSNGRSTSGVDHYDFGKDLYQHMIRLYTTTNMTADEIHQLGLSEVARLRSEMEKVKNQIGFDGELKAFFDFVRNNKSLMPFTEAQQVIDNFNAIHERIMPKLDQYFDRRPKAKFEVRQTEAFREASASAEYNPPSLDGARPGIFYVPIPDASKYNVYSDEDLFLHEAIPGHHYQLSLQQENEKLPSFRKTLWYSA